MTHRAAALLAALCASHAGALAQQEEGGRAEGAPPRAQLTLGPAVAVNAQPYEAGDGARLFPVPLVSYRRGRFAVFGTQATADIAEVGAVRLAALAAWRFQSYDEGDSPVLAGMADGRAASLRPQAGLRLQSASLTGYYFGVEADEAAVLPGLDARGEPFARPAYDPGGAWVSFVGATGRVPVSRRVSVFGLASYAVLPDTITDSPIVGRSGQVFALLGATYTFGGR